MLRLVQLFGEGGQLCLILIEGEVPSKDQYLEARVGWEEVLDLYRKRVGCADEDLRWNSLPDDQIGGEVLVGGIHDDRRIVVDGDAAREATERCEHPAKTELHEFSWRAERNDYVPVELFMRDTVLVVLRVGLPIKELGPLLVEVDQVLRELTPLGLVLDGH